MDSVTVEPIQKKPKVRVNYALAATLLTQGHKMDDIAPRVGAKNANVLRVLLHRKGVTERLCRTVTDAKGLTVTHPSLTLRIANQASDILREKFSNELSTSADILASIPKSKSLKHLKQRGEVLEPLVRSAKIVHNWSDTSITGLIVAGEMREAEAVEQTTIDSPSLCSDNTGMISDVSSIKTPQEDYLQIKDLSGIPMDSSLNC